MVCSFTKFIHVHSIHCSRLCWRQIQIRPGRNSTIRRRIRKVNDVGRWCRSEETSTVSQMYSFSVSIPFSWDPFPLGWVEEFGDRRSVSGLSRAFGGSGRLSDYSYSVIFNSVIRN